MVFRALHINWPICVQTVILHINPQRVLLGDSWKAALYLSAKLLIFSNGIYYCMNSESAAAAVVSQSGVPRLVRVADQIYRYPAKMTPRIAVSYMDTVLGESKPDDERLRFFDPMCGSGTTALIARWKGLEAACSDILYPATMIAKAKLNRLNDEGLDALREFSKTEIVTKTRKPKDDGPDLSTWFEPKVLRALQEIRDCIAGERRKRYYPHLSVALYRTIWEVSAADKAVFVPTHSKLSKAPLDITKRGVQGIFQTHLLKIIIAQEALAKLGFPTKRVTVTHGNALDRGNWPQWKPTHILTSPPYGCGLNYLRAVSLQDRVCRSDMVDSIARAEMIGRNLHLNASESTLPQQILSAEWVEDLRKACPKRLAALVQYLNDISRLLWIAKERMEKEGKLGILIGNPEMKGMRIPLNELVRLLSVEAGFRSISQEKEDRIKSRVQNFKLRSATAPIQSEHLLIFANG
jgi:site-specific DNA-methyltransferase (cytosine-N4-specific)